MFSVAAAKQKYDDCINRAYAWLNKNNYRTNFPSIISRMESENVIVKMSNPLHCMDWPERHDSGKKIDILAAIIETISIETGACTKSNLRVNYFRMDEKKATLTESLRYDYDCPPDTKHPICHVQNSNDMLKQDEWPESFNMRELKLVDLGNRCQNVRIPSAFVNLPGLFAILAADHMSERHWREFMEHCLVHFREIPPIEQHAVVDQAKEGLCVWNWYEM